LKLFYGFLLFFLGQGLIFIQTNGQFIWPWFKKNPWPVAIGFGSIISYILIYATRNVVEHFDGLLWPGRFIGFSSGIVIFAFMTYYLLGEGITTKTLISLALSLALVSVQIFFK
tara:strand:- start:1924 stop:2265 length:342 start_codon:yes stop_codon:yes gene_type:complete